MILSVHGKIACFKPRSTNVTSYSGDGPQRRNTRHSQTEKFKYTRGFNSRGERAQWAKPVAVDLSLKDPSSTVHLESPKINLVGHLNARRFHLAAQIHCLANGAPMSDNKRP